MNGKLLEDSGGATKIVETVVGRVGPGRLPWAMALIAAIIGLPLFFEVGVELLVPVVAGPVLAVLVIRMVPKLAPVLEPAPARARAKELVTVGSGGSTGSAGSGGRAGGPTPVGDDGVAAPGSVPPGRRRSPSSRPS